LPARRVPPPQKAPEFFSHSRLRRTSPITQFAIAAALEALGSDLAEVQAGRLRLGVVLCVMSGCVNYSRRFYDEALRDPATASPLVFPETVFNAPASHLGALVGAPALNYTLVGDSGTFLQGLALAADWLTDHQADACLVVGAEECDWLTSDAYHLFSRKIILSEGAGALYLKRESGPNARAELKCVTDANSFSHHRDRAQAVQRVRSELPAAAPGQLLVDSLQDVPRMDAAETEAWKDWNGGRLSPKRLLGEGLMAATAWQCALAVDALSDSHCTGASVCAVGCNQHAIGAHFSRVVG
jgi:3-oxoacyl-(acyl-carrier-protein) synthase